MSMFKITYKMVHYHFDLKLLLRRMKDIGSLLEVVRIFMGGFAELSIPPIICTQAHVELKI